MDKIYIFGHKNPDTDSVCGAITLSYLKNELGLNTEPRILGSINKETEYILNRFNVSVPRYLNDVKVQIKDVNYNKNYIANENSPVIDVFNFMNKNQITGLPLIDDNRKFKGYVSLKEIASDMILNENLAIDTKFENLTDTLEATYSLKFDDYIQGYAHAVTFDDLTYIREIPTDSKSIVIIGDRENVIRYCIEKKVKLIILIKNKKMSNELIELAKQNKVNIIVSSKSSFKVARVLCLANPIKTIKRGQKTITFKDTDYLTEFNDETSKLKHTNYPIVNKNNICLGMLRTIDAHEVSRKKVILVDHNMIAQSVDGLYESEIIEIIDHHNIGDINTASPINFRNMRVGSVNTIIYFLYKESNVKIPKNIAGLMLSGIISDTLLLKSPTTTEKDKVVAEQLAKIAGVDIQTYGLEMLESGVSIEGMEAHDIIYKDFKTYKVGEYNMAIGQVFTTDINIFKAREAELVKEINRVQSANDYKACVLFVTNFLTNDSNVLFADNTKRVIESAYGIEKAEQWQLLKGVVSRKQQMVPNIMNVIDHL